MIRLWSPKYFHRRANSDPFIAPVKKFGKTQLDQNVITKHLDDLVKKDIKVIKLPNFEYDFFNSRVYIKSNNWRLYCKKPQEYALQYCQEMWNYLNEKINGSICLADLF
jgi:hypothetical protein